MIEAAQAEHCDHGSSERDDGDALGRRLGHEDEQHAERHRNEEGERVGRSSQPRLHHLGSVVNEMFGALADIKAGVLKERAAFFARWDENTRKLKARIEKITAELAGKRSPT